MNPRTRARTPSSIASNQSPKSKWSAATAASFVLSFVMAWSPFQRANAGIVWVRQPGDYANPIPTTSATGPLPAAGVKIRERKHVAAASHARRAAALLRRLMKVPDRAFERALGMSPATLAEYAEAATRKPADLQATAPG